MSGRHISDFEARHRGICTVIAILVHRSLDASPPNHHDLVLLPGHPLPPPGSSLRKVKAKRMILWSPMVALLISIIL